ncbi:MAG: hypothetical protein HY956_00425, partial [Deltaproteobacteria bacterium]|nr:hypothetical protein [Deltaproteobacteria bacterium]
NTVTNLGTGSSASSDVKFYLSTDAAYDAADTYLGSRSLSSISASGTSSANTSVKIPVATTAGTYYIVAVADAMGSNPESDETNNTASTGAVSVSYGIDLTVASISAPASAAAGAYVTVANTVTNLGVGTSASSDIKFYLSTDAAFDSGDTYMGSRTLSSISGSGSSVANTSVRIPSTTAGGVYYIIGAADASATNPESDETNNTGSTGQISVSGL